MNLLSILLPGSTTREIEKLGREVAASCHASVRGLLGAAMQSMGLAEARGYVRARAGMSIRRATYLAIQGNKRVTEKALSRVQHLATERLVHALVREHFMLKQNSTTRHRKAA